MLRWLRTSTDGYVFAIKNERPTISNYTNSRDFELPPSLDNRKIHDFGLSKDGKVVVGFYYGDHPLDDGVYQYIVLKEGGHVVYV